MSKKVMVLLAEGFEEIEAITTIDILRRANIDTIVVGLDSEKVIGSHDIAIKADTKLEDINYAFDVCVLPGGLPGANNLASSERLKSIIKEMHDFGKTIAAICASPAIVLEATGILRNKNATCYPGMQKSFTQDIKYSEDNVVVDGNIITSRGPATAIDFALEIVKEVSGKEVSEKIKKALLAN